MWLWQAEGAQILNQNKWKQWAGHLSACTAKYTGDNQILQSREETSQSFVAQTCSVQGLLSTNKPFSEPCACRVKQTLLQIISTAKNTLLYKLTFFRHQKKSKKSIRSQLIWLSSLFVLADDDDGNEVYLYCMKPYLTWGLYNGRWLSS